MSGGIRDAESLERALATGCRRVNLGTAALEDPEWTARAIAEHGDRVAVGLDVRGTTLAARGWTREGGDLWETLARLDAEGCARYVVTDVTKDGMLQGPNLDLLRDVCARTDRPVVASGGVSTLDDSSPSAAWSATGSRARSSARRSTGARSRCPRRSTRRAAREPRPRPRPSRLRPGALGRARPLPSGFEADTGAADPALLAALAAAATTLALMRAVEAAGSSCRSSPTSPRPTRPASTRSRSRSTWPRSPSSRPTASAPCRSSPAPTP